MKALEPGDPAALKDGEYTTLGILGEGSMGRTYLVENRDGARFAIKTLFPSRMATLKDLELFHREADILDQLDHPNIPMYYDAFDLELPTGEMQYFLVQQYVDGETLRQKIKDKTRFDDTSIRELAAKILKVLVYLQAETPPVVHRDVKPDNLIIDSHGAPNLVDFGAVREVVRLTMGGGSTIIGSYGYMPPEQLMGRAIPSSDLYSLGVTLLECLTWQTPNDLTGRDLERIVSAANIEENTRRFLRRLCAPSIEERYPNAAEALADLERLSHGGELVAASRIESAIATREKNELEELKKQDRPGVKFYATLSAGILVSTSFVGLIYILFSVAQTVNTAFLAAGFVSALGLLGTVMLVGQRIVHDSWEAPDSEWRKTIGVVTEKKDHALFAENASTIKYMFRTRSGKAEGTTLYRNASKCEVGTEFVVYYKPSNPTVHECADLGGNEPADVSLFNPLKKH